MNAIKRVPVWIALLLMIDVALALAPVVNFLLGSPHRVLTNWINLDSERSIPNWYSSMQWLCAAVMFALVPVMLWRQRPAGWWILAALALLCLTFSVDEIVGMHEWLGIQADALLPGGDRANTGFAQTGLWPFVAGGPVVIALAGLGTALWRTLGKNHLLACGLMVVGFAIMFTGALVVELASNFIPMGETESGRALAQVVAEEFLEMLGVTIIVWSGYEFARDHGLALQAVSLPRPAHSGKSASTGYPLPNPPDATNSAAFDTRAPDAASATSRGRPAS